MLIAVLLMPLTQAWAFNLIEATYLLDIQQGTELSGRVANVRGHDYESAYGETISMRKWYSTRWTDAQISFLTQVNKKLGFIWGFSTGEKGEKYEISPSLKIGFIFSTNVFGNDLLSIRGHRIFFGALTEKSCVANYGDVGGVREVNCRLAATWLPPEETLRYNFDERPRNRSQLSIEYRKEF